MKRYNPKEIEPKWQQDWEATGIYKASEDHTKPKKYVLEYFPYPSGAAMHVGHVRNYTIGDAIARFGRMRGYNVLHPMGWDAFGLPAENYAIKNNISPQEAIKTNTAKFKQQLIQMGFSYDWSREIDSTDPNYYKWTQWFFTLLFQRGLAYRKESLVNWDPVDKTVLANEQVVNGIADRSGAKVQRIPLSQWFFKITDYADRLSDDLEDLNWTESIKSMQRNWIGKSTGAEVHFKIAGSDQTLTVFTTRPDTLFGATFMVVAPEHAVINSIVSPEQAEAVKQYQEESGKKSDIERQETDREKTGVFTGAYAINPINGAEIPVWVADYVLGGYGTGAVMAVPAHDQRDYEFAKKFDLPITYVVAPEHIDQITPTRPTAEMVERTVVQCIVKHPTEDKYLLLKRVAWETESYSYVVGGIDEGEKNEDAALRELCEEAGYNDVESIAAVGGPFFTEFYHEYKKVNRRAEVYTYAVKLKSLEQTEISEAEQKINSTMWASPAEVIKLVHGDGPKQIFQSYLQGESAYGGEGIMVNSGEYDGLKSSIARDKIVDSLAAKQAGQEKVNYKIRDWLISRQRYWGAPIPIVWISNEVKSFSGDVAKQLPKEAVTKEEDGKIYQAVPIPKAQLPVVLPEVESYQPDGSGKGPLQRAEAWRNVWFNTDTGETRPQTEPKPDETQWVAATRETDTMDGFACSSWYFLRFADPHNSDEPFSPEKAKFWLPVDDYVGGAEHAVMHLLYARMWTKVMFDEGLIDFNEPFKTLRNQGMILAPDGRKMSKSWGNVIAPDELIDQGYGADSIRIMELFIGPWNQQASWSVEGMGGCFRFLQRVWTLVQEYKEAQPKADTDTPEITSLQHRAIAKVSKDLDELGFNTAIATLMELVNSLYKIKAADKFAAKQWPEVLRVLTQLLAPFAPHITEELWQELGNEGSVHISEWPVHDAQYLVDDTVTIVVQVNGKVRATLSVSADSTQEEVTSLASKDSKVASYLEGEIKKVIFVPGKLINFVVSN